MKTIFERFQSLQRSARQTADDRKKAPARVLFFSSRRFCRTDVSANGRSLCSLRHTLHLQYRTLDQGWRGAHFASELSNQRRGRSVIAVKETLMKFFVWLIRVLVFVLLLVLALVPELLWLLLLLQAASAVMLATATAIPPIALLRNLIIGPPSSRCRRMLSVLESSACRPSLWFGR